MKDKDEGCVQEVEQDDERVVIELDAKIVFEDVEVESDGNEQVSAWLAVGLPTIERKAMASAASSFLCM